MKKTLGIVTLLLVYQYSVSQKPLRNFDAITTFQQQVVILYEHANYSGTSKSYGVGTYSLSDFNDVASSIRVPVGMVAYIFEHSTGNQGYGISLDLLEDCPDLSVYSFNDKVSFLQVFYANKDNLYAWARNSIRNGQYVQGHWERMRASGQGPANGGPVVSPPIPGPVSTTASVLSVNGPVTTINTLGQQTFEDKALWDRAQKQMGVIGNDFRGPEEIGTACFERASNNVAIPDNFNFWYPQKDPRDHRGIFKKTLCGMVVRSSQANIQGTYADFDVNIDIKPNPDYMYLLNQAHPRQYTDIMALQYQASKISVGNILTKPPWAWESSSGKPDCDDEASKEEFEQLEAEIAEDYWPKGNHTFGRARLADMALIRVGKQMCVYGTWIYDRGHCCHPEIHPAEQLWWQDTLNSAKKFSLNVVCDASRRFWWRNQMDDGTKLKPWAEPPIKGLFAIAFEYVLPNTTSAIGYTTRQFEADYVQHYNLTEYSNADQTYTLVYQGKNIVSFVPHNNAFKVSFEHVGISPEEPNKIKGFLVLETEVGKITQVATSITVPFGNSFQVIKLPANSTPDKAPEQYESWFFKKEEGHYYFTVTETSINNNRPVNRLERLNN